MKSFDGELAVVTGASRGIGLGTAAMLARGGAKVAMLARGAKGLESAAHTIGAAAIPISCDVSDAGAVDAAIASLAKHGQPSILVNNAGVFKIAPVERTSVADFEASLETNLLGPFRLIRALLPGMKSRGKGHIVTIGSIADRMIFPENAAYAASKFGARAMHEVLRMELRGSGVRTSLVSPGPVDTELWNDVDPDKRPGFTPRRDMLKAEAVADAVEFVLTRPADVTVSELRLARS